MALAATAHKVPTGMVNALEGPRITGKGVEWGDLVE